MKKVLSLGQNASPSPDWCQLESLPLRNGFLIRKIFGWNVAKELFVWITHRHLSFASRLSQRSVSATDNDRRAVKKAKTKNPKVSDTDWSVGAISLMDRRWTKVANHLQLTRVQLPTFSTDEWSITKLKFPVLDALGSQFHRNFVVRRGNLDPLQRFPSNGFNLDFP